MPEEGVLGVVEEGPVLLADGDHLARPVEGIVEEVGCDAGIVVHNVAHNEGEAGLVHPDPDCANLRSNFFSAVYFGT